MQTDPPTDRRTFLAAGLGTLLTAIPSVGLAMHSLRPRRQGRDSATEHAALFARIVDAREVGRHYRQFRLTLPQAPVVHRPVSRGQRYGIDHLMEDVGYEGYTDLEASRVFRRGERFFYAVHHENGVDAVVPFALRYRAAGTGGIAPGVIAAFSAPEIIALARAAQRVANSVAPARARELLFPIEQDDVPRMTATAAAGRPPATQDDTLRTAAGWLRIRHEVIEPGEASVHILALRDRDGDEPLLEERFEIAYRA